MHFLPCKKTQPTKQRKTPQPLNSYQRYHSKHLKDLNIPILRNMNRIWIGNQAILINLTFSTSLLIYKEVTEVMSKQTYMVKSLTDDNVC